MAPWLTARLLLMGLGIACPHPSTHSKHLHHLTWAHRSSGMSARDCRTPSRASPIASMPRRVVLVAGEGMQGSCFEGGGPQQPKCVLPDESQMSQVEGLLRPSPQGPRSSLLHFPQHILKRINLLHNKQSIIPSSLGFLCCN